MSTYFPLLPEIFLACTTCAILMWDLFLDDSQKYLNLYLSLLSLAGTFLLLWYQTTSVDTAIFSGAFVVDPLSVVLKMWVLAIVALVLVYSTSYLRDHNMLKGEYYVLALFGVLGMMIMISSGSMLTAYLGLEMLSLSLYAMVAFRRDSARSSEAAIKYFVLGALASGMLLYGISMVYGISGTISFAEIDHFLIDTGGDNIALSLGLACIVAGLAFKLGAVPFHMWVPDVYDGAPLSVTLYIASAPKIAGFALAIRFLADGLQALQLDWQGMLLVLAVLSLTIGNIVAIAQDNIKRMLAYSTISHIGFLMLGLLAGTSVGYAAAMFYALTYALTSTAGFGGLVLLSRRGFEVEKLNDLKGLFRRSPWFAMVMMLVLFSMAGVPPTVGFYAKLSVLKAIIDIEWVWLAVYAVLFSIIGAYYYLRAVKMIFFDEPQDDTKIQQDTALCALLGTNGLAVLGLGLFPAALMSVCVAVFPG